jgi:hypothetical protein
MVVRLQLHRHPADVAHDQRSAFHTTEDEVMDYLRQLQSERPVLFWAVTAVAFCVAFRLLLFVAALLLGPFGLPSWLPLVVVVGGLVLIARAQQRSR